MIISPPSPTVSEVYLFGILLFDSCSFMSFICFSYGRMEVGGSFFCFRCRTAESWDESSSFLFLAWAGHKYIDNLKEDRSEIVNGAYLLRGHGGSVGCVHYSLDVDSDWLLRKRLDAELPIRADLEFFTQI